MAIVGFEAVQFSRFFRLTMFVQQQAIREYYFPQALMLDAFQTGERYLKLHTITEYTLQYLPTGRVYTGSDVMDRGNA